MKGALIQGIMETRGQTRAGVHAREAQTKGAVFHGAKFCCDMQSNAGWRVHPLSSVSVREAHAAIPGNGGNMCVPVLSEMQT